MRKLSWTAEEAAKARVIGRRIAKARKDRGLSQAALALRLGLSQGRIARVEIGHTNLSQREVAEAVGVFETPVALVALAEQEKGRG